MEKRIVVFFFIVFVFPCEVYSQLSSSAILHSKDTIGNNILIRQPDSRLIFFTATGSNFYSDRVFANGDKDDAYNGIKTSKTTFKDLGLCKTRIAIQDKWDRILAGGFCTGNGKRTATLIRLNKQGNADPDFEGPAYISAGDSAEVNGICILPDEKMIIAGTCYTEGEPRFFLAKRIYNGANEPTFGTDGVRIDKDMPGNSRLISAAKLWDGKIVVCGYNYADGACNVLTARYNTDGGRDYSYGKDGLAMTDAPGGMYMIPVKAILLANNKLLVTGNYIKGKLQGIFTTRYAPDGSLDTTFGNRGFVTSYESTGSVRADDMALLPDSSILVSGAGAIWRGAPAGATHVFLRMSENGIADSNYGYGNGAVSGLGAHITQKGYAAVAYSIVTAPLNGKAYRLTEMIAPKNTTETIITLATFLPDTDLGIIDMPDKNNQQLIYPVRVKDNITFQYDLADSQRVTIKLYDKQGTETATILNDKMQLDEYHKFTIRLPASAEPGKYEAILTTSEGYKTTLEINKQ